MKKYIFMFAAVALFLPSLAFGYIKGNINHDNIVDSNDLAILQGCYNTASTSPAYVPDADIDSNGYVDFGDLGTLLNNLGQTEPVVLTPAPIVNTGNPGFQGSGGGCIPFQPNGQPYACYRETQIFTPAATTPSTLKVCLPGHIFNMLTGARCPIKIIPVVKPIPHGKG